MLKSENSYLIYFQAVENGQNGALPTTPISDFQIGPKMAEIRY